ncbi:MAG TPA: ABC transporter permease, partial [Roseovarius nubinhibens]|nr:ABC transporter permease [Roseovarius nubinhibens]
MLKPPPETLHPMHILAFLIRRAVQAVIVMFVISLIGFSIQDNLGDPLRELVGQSVSEAERQELRDQLGLNDPFLTQYIRFLGNAVQGDLGTSYFFKRPALDVIMDKFPATFELVIGAVVIFLSLSIPAGIYCAIHRNSWITRIIMTGSIIGISVPVFLTAIFMVWLFGVELGWLPAFGRGDTVTLPWGWDTGFLT